MDNKAQVSIEYLIMVGVGVTIAAIILLLVVNLFGIKDGIKELIDVYRTKTFNIK